MGIIVDLIIIAIVLLFVFIGYKKGLTGSLIKLLSFVIAVALAFMLYKPVANAIIENTEIDDNIKEAITRTFNQEDNNEKEEEKNIPLTMVENINNEIENATNEVKTTIIEETTKTIINVASAIVIYIIVRIILLIVSLFASQITKLPLIKQADEIGGIVYGAVEGIVIVYIALSIISLISVIWVDNIAVTAITKSVLGNMLYNNNIILKLLFK